MPILDTSRIKKLAFVVFVKFICFALLSFVSLLLSLYIATLVPIPRTSMNLDDDSKHQIFSKSFKLCDMAVLRGCAGANLIKTALDMNRFIRSSVDDYFDNNNFVVDNLIMRQINAAENIRRSVAHTEVILDFEKCADFSNDYYRKFTNDLSNQETPLVEGGTSVGASSFRKKQCLYVQTIIQDNVADYKSVGLNAADAAKDLSIIADKLHYADRISRDQDIILIKLGEVVKTLNSSSITEEICEGSPDKNCRSRLKDIRQSVDSAIKLIETSRNPPALIELRKITEEFWMKVLFWTTTICGFAIFLYLSKANILEIGSIMNDWLKTSDHP